MKKAFIGLFLCLITSIVIAQKHYIWCPPDIVSSLSPQGSTLSGQTVLLSVKDLRTFTGKVDNKCSPEEIISSVSTSLRAAYPNAVFRSAPLGKSEPIQGEVLVSVEITAYSAYFNMATWHAATNLSVTILDYRSNELHRFSKSIEKKKSFFNALGTITAKSNMKKCYESAIVELIDFITDTCKS